MKISKVVLPAAGLGTRLLPITKETPKEMLPIYVKGRNGNLYLKPMLQAVFEQLFGCGFKEFVFIVGRGKRAIEDHFTKDTNFLGELRDKGKLGIVEEMEDFYSKVEASSVVFVNQPEPKGFGDSVLRAKSFVGEDFLVHAGDTYILSKGSNHITGLLETHQRSGAKATFISQVVEDPRSYGVVRTGQEANVGALRVEGVVEKPSAPESNLAIMPVYAFSHDIFEALDEVEAGVGGELQLTDGIQRLIEKGLRVDTVKLGDEDVRLDIGDPEMFWEALRGSRESSLKS